MLLWYYLRFYIKKKSWMLKGTYFFFGCLMKKIGYYKHHLHRIVLYLFSKRPPIPWILKGKPSMNFYSNCKGESGKLIKGIVFWFVSKISVAWLISSVNGYIFCTIAVKSCFLVFWLLRYQFRIPGFKIIR